MMFEDLDVWQRSMEVVTEVYRLCRSSALSQDFGLRDQLQRAAVSIPANIAEGYERLNRKETIQFMGIAKGSAGEVRSLIQVAGRLEYITQKTEKEFVGELWELSRMLKGLINSLKRRSG